MALEVPTGPEDLTPAWVTAALRESGTITDATVTDIEVRQIGVGRGTQRAYSSRR